MFSRKKVREMEAQIAALKAESEERKAQDADAAEKERRKLPEDCDSLKANQYFQHKGKHRVLISLPARAVSGTKSIDQWALVDLTDGKLTRMGIVDTKWEVLDYMSANFYKRM